MGVRTPVKFIAGSKVLFAVPRNLKPISLSLEEAIDGATPNLPPLTEEEDGYRILSAPLLRKTEISRAHPKLACGAQQTYRRHYIDMKGTFDEYMARYSGKTRSTLRRKGRKLKNSLPGPVEIREYRTPAEMDLFRDLALPLSSRTYQAKSLAAGLPASEAAHELRKELAARDQVRAYLLCADDKPVSYLYLTVENRTVNYAFLGYDPDQARLSPGTVLQLKALERLFAEQQYRYFDFTEGDGAHKAMFGTDKVECCSFLLLKPTVRNGLLLRSLDFFDASVARAKTLVDRTGALGKMRMLLRR